MKYQIKALTEKGIKQFYDYWAELRNNPELEWPKLNSFESYTPARLKLGGKSIEKRMHYHIRKKQKEC